MEPSTFNETCCRQSLHLGLSPSSKRGTSCLCAQVRKSHGGSSQAADVAGSNSRVAPRPGWRRHDGRWLGEASSGSGRCSGRGRGASCRGRVGGEVVLAARGEHRAVRLCAGTLSAAVLPSPVLGVANGGAAHRHGSGWPAGGRAAAGWRSSREAQCVRGGLLAAPRGAHVRRRTLTRRGSWSGTARPL